MKFNCAFSYLSSVQLLTIPVMREIQGLKLLEMWIFSSVSCLKYDSQKPRSQNILLYLFQISKSLHQYDSQATRIFRKEGREYLSTYLHDSFPFTRDIGLPAGLGTHLVWLVDSLLWKIQRALT